MDVWILCKKENGSLTGIGIERDEARCRNLAEDGDYVAIPIHLGRLYSNIIDAGIVGAVNFPSDALRTLIQQAKDALVVINGRLDALENQMQTIITQGQAMNQAIQDLDARVTALEGG